MKILDNIENGKCIVWHSTRSNDLADIIIRKEFQAGRGGGAMIGPGFYANLHLYQAQKHNYGPLILKAEIKTLDYFFFLEYEPFERWFGNISSEKDFIKYQLEKFGISIQEDWLKSRLGSTANSAVYLWNHISDRRNKVKIRPTGVVYKGNFDGLSLVCWKPKLLVVPLAISADDGETWIDADKDSFEKELEKEIKRKEIDLYVDPEVRSDKRVEDFKKKYEGKSDDAILKGIKAHLAKIKDPVKLKTRTEAFTAAYPSLSKEIKNEQETPKEDKSDKKQNVNRWVHPRIQKFFETYQGRSEKQVLRAINSALIRIKDRIKFERNREDFEKAFPEYYEKIKKIEHGKRVYDSLKECSFIQDSDEDWMRGYKVAVDNVACALSEYGYPILPCLGKFKTTIDGKDWVIIPEVCIYPLNGRKDDISEDSLADVALFAKKYNLDITDGCPEEMEDYWIEDADEVVLSGNKKYTIDYLKENPPKWIKDKEMWGKILDKVTKEGTVETKITTPLAIYKRKLEKKQKAEKSE